MNMDACGINLNLSRYVLIVVVSIFASLGSATDDLTTSVVVSNSLGEFDKKAFIVQDLQVEMAFA